MAVAMGICAQASGSRSRRGNREAILVAGRTLFARHGPAGVTFDDVARETGLTRRTIYNHFANVDDLFVASIQAVLRQLHGRLPAAPPIEMSTVPALDRFVRELLRLFTNPTFVDAKLVLTRHGSAHPALHRAFEQRILAPLYASFAGYLRTRAGRRPSENPLETAQHVVTVVLGLAETARLLGHVGEDGVHHALPLARLAADALVHGPQTRFDRAA
ncbi:TetR/AcrR family transcriptional regulator [Sphingomonas sp. HITSZ_GF]|uniref:TetR/AcrR family transcriptional regulator n=1 Tax=Sphingomonas sp. HITSZ_GF TaxID=3037247 RepID=UPI00240DD47C|nr:TetR/AcrR family transcriptional regulator [Sphingomonas sp. HITSZ_GF]MDG2534226.1 TetR/AcrR family transcriptional regulator [Sphingomonas sp. HITSZ_GF]